MHIIKITPQSFKIVLSKEDLKHYGISDISENNFFEGELFAEITYRISALYSCPLEYGAIDAEFFESKDGGGELFLSHAKGRRHGLTYLFITDTSHALHLLCKRLYERTCDLDSRLYFYEGKYNLVIFTKEYDETLLYILLEYGFSDMAKSLYVWHLEEHARLLVDRDAIGTMAKLFS